MILAFEINQNNFSPAKFSSISSLMRLILPLLMLAAALFFLIVLLQAAFRILTAGDNKEIIEKTKKTIMFAILGLVLIISSFFLVRIIGLILKVNFPL